MEFENTKFREDLYQPLILPNSYLKPETGDEFGFDSCSSKEGGFFHDLHNLEHHHQDFSILDPIDHHHPPPPSSFENFYDPKEITMQTFDGGDGGGEVVVGRRLVPLNCEVFKPVSSVVPDEGSSSITSAENGYYKELVGGRSKETRRSSKISRKMKTSSVKGQWTMDEDRTLIQLVEKYGVRKWSQIAQMLKGRVGKQCRERWHNHLRPDIKKDTWSEEEDKILIEAHVEIGNKWAEIAKRLPGRTENSIKNHWNATKRRQYSRRKCRSKYPRPSSLLQNYIKSLMGLPDTNSPTSPVKTPPPPPLRPVVNNQMEEEETTNMEEFCASDRLVPDYDFDDDVPEFRFNENLFEEGRIDSILDTVGPAPPLQALRMGDDHNERFAMEEGPMMRREVKKEMDLMEMISQGNF